MPTLIECPSCRRQLQVPDDLVGKKVQCPGCGLTFTTTAGGRPSGPPSFATPGDPGGQEREETAASFAGAGEPYAQEFPRSARSGASEAWEFDERRSYRGRGLLLPPAICLLLIGIVGMLGSAYFLAVSLLVDRAEILKQMGPAATPQEREIQIKFLDIMTGVGFNSAFLGVGLIVTLGAVMMLVRRMYALAVFSSILAMIHVWPCCCLLGLPVGIWSLVVLSRPEVKAIFK